MQSGPRVVSGSIGSPGFSFSSSFLNDSRNLSAMLSWSNEALGRDAAPVRCFACGRSTPHFTALSRSALSRTMNEIAAAEFHRALLQGLTASEATADPALSLPVKATPLIRRSAITLADCSFVIKTLVHVPTGAPASRNSFSNAERALRHIRAHAC